jgi:hypothetical protein
LGNNNVLCNELLISILGNNNVLSNEMLFSVLGDNNVLFLLLFIKNNTLLYYHKIEINNSLHTTLLFPKHNTSLHNILLFPKTTPHYTRHCCFPLNNNPLHNTLLSPKIMYCVMRCCFGKQQCIVQ